MVQHYLQYGVALGGLATALSGGAMIDNAIATDYEHKLLPDSAVGLASGGDINFAKGMNTFYFYHYSIKKEFAEMIDNYFEMYGYKVNSLEVPSLHTRTYWNYLKVLDPNIEGANIPETDINKFKRQLQAGITFWHDSTHFRDYSQTNSVVS